MMKRWEFKIKDALFHTDSAGFSLISGAKGKNSIKSVSEK